MKNLFIISWIVITMACIPCRAKLLFPNSDTASKDVELGVEGISRLCPTGLWDSWTFRDIAYDKESNTVVFVIQIPKWNEHSNGKEITEAEVQIQAEWIVANIKEGYDELIKNPSVRCYGDFMLYLSLVTFFKQMEKEGTNLRIMLLKPDYYNQVFGDMPMTLSSRQIIKDTSKR